MLQALKQNLPIEVPIHQRYVQEYNNMVVELENASETHLREFIVSEHDLGKKPPMYFISHAENFSPHDEYCERALFFIKIDSLLSYFSVCLSGEKPEIGFKPPKK